MSLGDALRVLRNRRGLSLTAYAKLVGVSKQAVSSFERSQAGTNESTLRKYSNALGYTPFLVLRKKACDNSIPWSEHLRRLRGELDLPATDVAEVIGCNVGAIYDAESAESIGEHTVYRLCDAMGVAVDFGFKKGSEIVLASSLAVARKLSFRKMCEFLEDNGWRLEPEPGPDFVVYQIGDDPDLIERAMIPNNRGRPSYGPKMLAAIQKIAFAMKVDPEYVRRAAQD